MPLGVQSVTYQFYAAFIITIMRFAVVVDVVADDDSSHLFLADNNCAVVKVVTYIEDVPAHDIRATIQFHIAEFPEA